MNLTISLEGPVVQRLQEAAAARSLSPEQMVQDVMGAFLDKVAEEERWRQTNARRIELINKELNGGLTAAEGEELDRLQDLAAERVAPMDRLLIAGAEQVLRRAKELRDATGR